MNTRVVITGVGAISSLGNSAEGMWNALISNRSGIQRVRRFVEAELPSTIGGEVELLPPETPDRHVTMAKLAVSQAMTQAEVEPESSGLIWSVGLDEYPSFNENLRRTPSGSFFRTLAEQFRAPRRMIATACASGTQAIGEAFRLVRSGFVPRCVAGGSSTMLAPFFLIGFHGLHALASENTDDVSSACKPFDRRRSGFVLSDGAGAVVLEDLDQARQRGAPILAEVRGYGMSQDAYDLNKPHPDGLGAVACMRRAFDDAAMRTDELGGINAHATGTVLGDVAESRAIRSLLPESYPRVPVSSVKGAIGHAQAAAGALEAIVATFSTQHMILPPTANLSEPDPDCEVHHVISESEEIRWPVVISNSFGMGGQNASLIISRPAL